MTGSNQDNHLVHGSSPSFDGWCWLKSRLDSLADGQATQQLQDWMSGELDSLEHVYSDLITETSRNHAASLLVEQRRS